MDFLNKIRLFINNYQKLLFLIFFIAIICIVSVVFYNIFFKKAEVPIITQSKSTSTPSQGLPSTPTGPGQIVSPSKEGALPSEESETEPSPIANGGLTQVSNLNDSASAGVTLAKDGEKIQYYNKSDGKFYKVDSSGNASLLSDKVFHNVETIVWNSNKEKAILEYPDGANIIYDFSTNKQVTLPKHWEDFSYSPSGDDIVAKSIGLDPNNRWLIISSDDGATNKPIESIGKNANIVTTAWSPNNQMVAMYVKSTSFDRQELFFVGLNGENFKSTIIEGRGFIPLWSPSGNRLLYSVYSAATNLKPNLWIVDAQGQNIGNNRKNLHAETWANKCVFKNSENIICAVPENIPEGAGLFPEMAENTNDNLYQINTISGNKKLLAVPDGTFNISNISISEDGKYLFFTDNFTEKLYKIRLY